MWKHPQTCCASYEVRPLQVQEGLLAHLRAWLADRFGKQSSAQYRSRGGDHCSATMKVRARERCNRICLSHRVTAERAGQCLNKGLGLIYGWYGGSRPAHAHARIHAHTRTLTHTHTRTHAFCCARANFVSRRREVQLARKCPQKWSIGGKGRTRTGRRTAGRQ
eukprot:10529126-Alexandrium_andersonii.AAC.1